MSSNVLISSNKLSPIPRAENWPENFSDELLEEIWEEDARNNLAWFLEYESKGAWQPARHLLLLCEKMEAVERGEIRRLMVFMPPRHGKSEVVSKKFPAWFLGRNPDKEIIIASYSADLAFDHSRIARETLREWGHLWGVELAEDSQAVGRWGIKGHRGALVAAGVGGPVTGRGAHVAIIDDPIKNWEEAASQVIRERVWNWYKTTLRTRVYPDGAIVLVMTRWHHDDLAGRLLKEMEDGTGEEWEVLRLPCEAEDEDDPLGRKPGETLWPERGFDKEWARETKKIGTFFWNALYQQRPAPEEGSIFKRSWWKFYRTPPSRFDVVIQSWDCAFKDTKASDFVAGEVWGRVGADFYLLDRVKDRMDFVTTLQAIRTMTAKWPKARGKLIEEAANGPAVISMLKREIPGIIPVKPKGSKVARAMAVQPLIEAGNVYLPDPSIAPWVHDFIEECAVFPNGAHDDQVDAMTQALLRLSERQAVSEHVRQAFRGASFYG